MTKQQFIESAIKKIVYKVLCETTSKKSWKGSINVRSIPVTFEWWLTNQNDAPSEPFSESDKYDMMATAKDDIAYAINKQDATNGKLEYGGMYTGKWQIKK